MNKDFKKNANDNRNQTPKEYCFVILKPETINRGLIGVMISKLEESSGKICSLEMQQPKADKIRQLYVQPDLDMWREEIIKDYMKGDLVTILIVGKSGLCKEIEKHVVNLRKEYGISKRLNGIHSSDNNEKAIREAKLFLSEDVLYKAGINKHIGLNKRSPSL